MLINTLKKDKCYSKKDYLLKLIVYILKNTDLKLNKFIAMKIADMMKSTGIT